MPIGDYCRREVVTATPKTTLRAAAQLMAEKGVGALPVVYGGEVTGIVTDRDVALAVLNDRRDADATELGELLLHKPLIVVHEDSALGVAAAMMRRHALRRLPVLDAEERLVGIITSDDVLQLVARELGGLARATASQAPGAQAGGLRPGELADGEGL